MNNFKDKTVIITGGSEGVGAATARKFAAAGAKLLLVARGKKNLEKITKELQLDTRMPGAQLGRNLFGRLTDDQQIPQSGIASPGIGKQCET